MGGAAITSSGTVDTITMKNCTIASVTVFVNATRSLAVDGNLSYHDSARYQTVTLVSIAVYVHMQASAVHVSDFKSILQFTDCRFTSTIGTVQSSYGETISHAAPNLEFMRCDIIIPQA